jgi:hypothetical protein
LSTLFGLLLLLTCGGCAASSKTESVEAFGRRVGTVISSGDTEAFRKIPCFPSACASEDDARYVFGSDADPSPIRQLFRFTAFRMKVFGPFTYEEDRPNGSYAIVYYRSEAPLFSPDGVMKPSTREREWLKSYVETVVTRTPEGWAFHRTPFYRAAHLPWASDY